MNPRVRITGPAGYRRYLSDTPLVPFRGGVLSLWRENSRAARPTRLALVWRDLEADTVTVLEAWDGERLVRMGDFVAADPLFGPRVIATLDAQGTVAVGYGTEYCIDIHAVGQRRPRRVCRNREPAPVGAGIRDPDLSPIENEARREAYAAVVREQPIAEHLPYYDRLLFDEGGRLWVRTLGPELSEIHPYVLRAHPELGPAHRAWDVFAPAGQLIVTLEIPSTFEPEAITSDAIYGFVELSTGEIAIGALAVPFRPDPTRPAGSGLVSDARDDRRLMETG